MDNLKLHSLSILESGKKPSTKEKIYNKAKVLFIRKGYYGTSVSDIAINAGVNKALVNYYFKSKEMLYLQIFRQCFREVFSMPFAILGRDIELFEKIELFAKAVLEKYLDNSDMLNFVLCEMHQNRSTVEAIVIEESNIYFLPNFKIFSDQVKMKISKGQIKKVEPITIIIDLLSLLQSPIMHQKIFRLISDDPKDFESFVKARANYLSSLIIYSLKNNLSIAKDFHYT